MSGQTSGRQEKGKKGQSKSGEKGGRPRKLTKKDLLAGIALANGNRGALRAHLRISERTLAYYFSRWPDVKEVYTQSVEDRFAAYKSMAHTGFWNKLKAEEWPAIKFALSTICKEEGFRTGTEVTGPGGGPQEIIVFEPVADNTPLSERNE